MREIDLYQDIARRTGGDVYIGVVGPVRAGKSTFIAKVMNELVLPLITDPNVKARAVDELPQSADGKTIMTTQPKFVPSSAVGVELTAGVQASVRLVDCVGYVTAGAVGADEDGRPRLVKTPWSDVEMPFEEAAEYGTKKVIEEHSTIGIVVTTDGSIGTDLPRASYAATEARVIADMKATGKPFLVLVNTTQPTSAETLALCEALGAQYGASVRACDVAKLTKAEIDEILESVMLEFPIASIDLDMPKWMQTLDADSALMCELSDLLKTHTAGMERMRDYTRLEGVGESERIEGIALQKVLLGEGRIVYAVVPKPDLFWRTVSEQCGESIDSDFALMSHLKKLVYAKRRYDKLASALEQVSEKGYGIVEPSMEDMTLAPPELVKQGSHYGVRLRATAPSLHIIQVDVNTEVSPIVATEQQSEEIVSYLMQEFEHDPEAFWNTQMFGRPLSVLVEEEMNGKVHSIPADTAAKMKKTLTRIVNEGKGGVLCILL